MAINIGDSPMPIGNTWRGFGADWLNAPNIAREDFQRQWQLDEYNRQFNSIEAQKNREWQTEMSNTAYQRAVEDMKKAGINPIMAYSAGASSTPSGASASGSTSSNPSKGSFVDSSSSVGSLANLVNLVAGLVIKKPVPKTNVTVNLKGLSNFSKK